VKDAFSFSAPSARYVASFRLWLQQKKLGIPEEERSGWNGKISMMRNGCVPVGMLFGAANELARLGYEFKIEEWKHKPKVELTKGFNEADKKYQYQNEAVQAMLNSIATGGGLVLSATGTGKSKIAAQCFSWLKCDCLFIVDTLDLLYQAQTEIQEWLSSKGYDKEVGIVGNSKFNPQRITVATIQTLHKHARKKTVRDWLRKIDVILIDEIHTQMARRNFKVIDIAEPQAVIGLTATMQLKRKPVRFKCYAICGPLIFTFPIEKGVEAGVLSQGVVVQIPVEENNKKRRLVKAIVDGEEEWRAVDDYTHQVVDNVNCHNMIKDLVRTCLAEDLCVVVLVERIKHLKTLAKRLKEYAPKLFYGAIKVSDRKKQLKQFDKGKADLILANKVFTKGINLKRIDVVIDVAQRANKNDCIQKFGRAVRLHTEKAGVYFFDIFTEGKMEKAAKSRKGAFKKAKIPIKVLTTDFTRTSPWSSREILSEADILLRKALKETKQKNAQGELFA
jgi:superfamily II DNA or RNA helicase